MKLSIERGALLKAVGQARGFFQAFVIVLIRTGYQQILPELFFKRLNLALGFFETVCIAGHAAVRPHDLAELAGHIVDGALAASESERARFWQIRENFEPEQKKFDLIYGYDVSLPLESMADYVESVRSELTARFADAELFAYGHIGDGNLHFNLSPPVDGATRSRGGGTGRRPWSTAFSTCRGSARSTAATLTA